MRVTHSFPLPFFGAVLLFSLFFSCQPAFAQTPSDDVKADVAAARALLQGVEAALDSLFPEPPPPDTTPEPPPPPPPDTTTPPPPAVLDTSAVSLVISPQAAALVVGDTLRFTAVVRDSSGTQRNYALQWRTSNNTVADISGGGRLTARAPGTVNVRSFPSGNTAIADTVVVVIDSVSASPPPPPPDTVVWDSIISGISISGDLIVPDGEKWLIGANVSIDGNVRTEGGTIAMRPGSSLRFVNVVPTRYVGGGMRYADTFQNDYGIWVGGSGRLDIQCTPKEGWNRSGPTSSSGWQTTDELWITPFEAGDYEPRRITWEELDSLEVIPQADERVPPAEIANVTRDCEIRGGHIHISSNQPQTIEYVTLREMGVLAGGSNMTSGRYALHFHFMGDGARGSTVKGVACVDGRGRCFVPHASHGVTFTDNVAINGFGEGFWWDDRGSGDIEVDAHSSHDIAVDRLLVCGVFVDREITGSASRFDAISLPFGTDLSIRNSVACGARGNKLANGFDWPSGHRPPAVWDFSEGNVAHNNSGEGIRFWNNSGQPHTVSDFITYHNGAVGITNGAYSNANRYADVLLIGNHLFHHSGSRPQGIEAGRPPNGDSGPARYERLTIEVDVGPAIEFIGVNTGTSMYTEFIDCDLRVGSGKKIHVNKLNNPQLVLFRDCGLTPADVQWNAITADAEGTHFIFENGGVRSEVRIVNQQPVVD